ncbi:hypothetical protein B0F90DRAFT_1627345 [Multifurca ochricompacta]|uniref:N-acetyltransferase domain-containing protein n=1 Tax=Multifurca ochricompacta TaxID=376703 RepID=A0AAD4QP78_9AGAM|nr:hypothetical protein B0F90DRAFT_1627345 [Multifurca ochricompacta]
MSAYGTITTSRSVNLLPSTTWEIPEPAPGKPTPPFRHLVLHHLRLNSARSLPSLLEYTHQVFATEVEEGRTYPQEVAAGGDASSSSSSYTREAFEAYFWGADVIIAIGTTNTNDDRPHHPDRPTAATRDSVDGGKSDLETARAGRSWKDTLVGFYYVKPNYPGRSSHICNAGFVIPPHYRQFGYGKILGKSYLHYGPSLGYKASVFNLVYTTNTGSLRIWDSLGFKRAGLIPRAGRLRRADGSGEDWVDSVIYYRSFVEEEEWGRQIE